MPTETPRRIQRQRTKGWRMPANTVYVGRPTKWGNSFSIEPEHAYTRLSAVAAFRNRLVRLIAIGACDLNELRGKHLACWCRLDQPCHADVLLELAHAD